MFNKNIKWNFCPSCGVKLPYSENLKFCTNCGIDLVYFKEHKTLPPTNITSTSISQTSKSSFNILSDDEILYTRKKKLWGNLASIGLPLLAFVIMNGLILGIVLSLVLIIGDINFVINLVYNPFFIVFSTLVELILIILPIWFIKKYLRNPKIENRLTLLGFTIKGYDRKKLLHEILIGIGFAFVGILLVVSASVGIQLILEYVFGIEIIREEPSSSAENMVTAMDILILILMILMMLFIVGPCEEILFRGFMQRGLVRNLGDTWGIIITAIIFASIHLVGLIVYIFDPIIFTILFIIMFAPYIAISLMLGYMFRWREENLIAVIVTHGVYNSLTIIIVFLFMVYG